MENKTLEKALDLGGSVAKLAANITDVKKEKPTPKPTSHQVDDNSNNAQTGNQSVVVAVEKGKKKEPKPIEQHIHEFPENRSLTTEECELSLKKAQMDYELKKSQQNHIAEQDKREWEYMLEKEKKEARRRNIKRVIGGVLATLGIGVVGYSVYADYRDRRLTTPKLPETPTVKADGNVK